MTVTEKTRVPARAVDVERHLRRMLGSAAEARDVLEETWIAARWRPPDDPDPEARAELFRRATSRALDRLATGPGADSRARVRDGVSRLPRVQREAVWLRWIEGLGYEEVAGRLGCSPDAARASAYDGMKRLRSAVFEGREPAPGADHGGEGLRSPDAGGRGGRLSKSGGRIRLDDGRRKRT